MTKRHPAADPGADPAAGAASAHLQARAQRTREAIIEQAARTFERQNYFEASLNEIIKAAGLTKGAFYHHFSSKEELALAVFRAKQAELVRRLREAAADQPHALLALRQMVLTRAQLLESEPALRCFLRLASELGVRYGPGSEFAASYAVPIGVMTELVLRGQREGVIRKTLDPRAAGETIFAALLGTDEMAKVISGGAGLVQRSAAWLEVLLAGLAEPNPPPLVVTGTDPPI